MAFNQKSSDNIEPTKSCPDEDLSSKLGVSCTSKESCMSKDAFYIELLNEDSNDSKTGSTTKTHQSHDAKENVIKDQFIEDTICIYESCSPGCDKKLETAVVNMSDNVSSNTTPQSTFLEGKILEELPTKSIAEQKSNEVQQHHNSGSWTEDSSSSSSDSDFFEELLNSFTPKATAVKTKGELDLEDLPPIEDLLISVEEKELMKIGKIYAIVTKQVVVAALKDQKPLDLESVLFLSHNKPLGRIFDVFGPVSEPFYIVRFNSPEDIISKGIIINADVYFAPQKSDITSFVFVDALRLQKGSDASWKDNNEPPEKFLDYSDDEQERKAKQKRRGKNRSRPDADVQIISSKKPNNNAIKSAPTMESTRNVFSKYMETKFQPQGNFFQPQTIRNPFRRTYYSMNNDRKFAAPVKSHNNRSSPAHTSTSLDDVPIWISSPPPIFQSPVSTSQQNMSTTVSTVSMHFEQQSSLQHNSRQLQSPQPAASFSPMPLIRPAQLKLFPKQPFIPRQPHHLTPSTISQTQTQFQRNEYYIHPPRPLMHQQIPQNTISQAPVFQNLNQPPSYRPIISTIAPVMSFSPQALHSRTSNSVTPSALLPTNYQTSAASPFSVSGNNLPLWQQREQQRSTFTVAQSSPSTVQFSTQVPSFPSLPPLIRFNANQNCQILPQQPPPSSLSQQFFPNSSRY